MTVGGQCYPLPTVARRTAENESGFLRTVKASESDRGGMGELSHQVKTGSPRGIPTPKANDAEKRGDFDATNPRNGLPAFAKMWPTPNVCGGGSPPEILTKHKGHYIIPSGKKAQLGLDQAVRLEEQKTGRLNPEFVCWLMNWPRGSTEIFNEKLPSVRQGIDAQEIRQRNDGRRWMFCSPEALRQIVYGRSNEKRPTNKVSNSEAPRFSKDGLLRVLRSTGSSFDSSQGQGLAKQRSIEFDDAVQFVSHLFASQSGRHCEEERTDALHNLRQAVVQAWAVLNPSDTIQEAWQSMPRAQKDWCILAACAGHWAIEYPGVGRLAHGVADWKHRIFALGNGQVPRVHAAAWRMLTV
jgi:hypothetical protein